MGLQMARDATRLRIRRAVVSARELERLEVNGGEHLRRNRVQPGFVESDRRSRYRSGGVNQKKRRHGLRIVLARHAQVSIQHDGEFDWSLVDQLNSRGGAVLRDSDDLSSAIQSLRQPVEIGNRQTAGRAIGLEE